MKMTRIYADKHNESHFEDCGELVFENAGDLGKLSEKFNANSMRIHEFGAGLFLDWHISAVGKICVIPLVGQIEIEVTDGSKRIFGSDDIFIEESLRGSRGIRTRAYGDAGGKLIVFGLK